MRLSALSAPAPLPASRGGPVGAPLKARPWAGAAPRRYRPAGAVAGLPPLDAGFFFPLGAAAPGGFRALRRLRLRVGHAGRPRAAVRRALGLWEALGGGRLRVPTPLPRGPGAAGSRLRGPNMALSLRRTLGRRRIYRPRLRRLRRLGAYRPHGRGLPGAAGPAAGLGERLLGALFRGRRPHRGAEAAGRAGLAPRAPGAGPGARPPQARPPRGPRLERRGPTPQVRYKPGLPRFWRALRLQFCLAWGLPWARQRRLTSFIAQLRGVTGLGFLQMCLGGLGVLLRESGLLPQGGLARGGWVNGRLVRNPFFQLYRGDRVVAGPTEGLHPRRDLTWLAPLRTAPAGTWEVDGLTRAVTVIADPGRGSRPLVGRPTPFLTFRMYN